MKKILFVLLSLIILSATTFVNAAERNKFSFEGIYPGIKFEEVKKIWGEPVSVHDDDEFRFSNGAVVEIKKFDNTVEEIKVYRPGISTDAGISTGMTEQDLLNAYGRTDFVDRDVDGIEYKYFSSDKEIKIEFEIKGGIITEIKSKLHD